MTKNLLLLLTMSLSLSCLDEKQQSEMILRHYIAKNVDNIRSFTMESAVALWNANISGVMLGRCLGAVRGYSEQNLILRACKPAKNASSGSLASKSNKHCREL